MTVGWGIVPVMNKLSKAGRLSGDHHPPILPPLSVDELQLMWVDPPLDGFFVLFVLLGLQSSHEHFIWQNHYTFVVFFPLTVIRPSRQSVSLPIGASLQVVNFDVIISKFKHFPGHTSADLLGVPPIL